MAYHCELPYWTAIESWLMGLTLATHASCLYFKEGVAQNAKRHGIMRRSKKREATNYSKLMPVCRYGSNIWLDFLFQIRRYFLHAVSYFLMHTCELNDLIFSIRTYSKIAPGVNELTHKFPIIFLCHTYNNALQRLNTLPKNVTRNSIVSHKQSILDWAELLSNSNTVAKREQKNARANIVSSPFFWHPHIS